MVSHVPFVSFSGGKAVDAILDVFIQKHDHGMLPRVSHDKINRCKLMKLVSALLSKINSIMETDRPSGRISVDHSLLNIT